MSITPLHSCSPLHSGSSPEDYIANSPSSPIHIPRATPPKEAPSSKRRKAEPATPLTTVRLVYHVSVDGHTPLKLVRLVLTPELYYNASQLSSELYDSWKVDLYIEGSDFRCAVTATDDKRFPSEDWTRLPHMFKALQNNVEGNELSNGYHFVATEQHNLLQDAPSHSARESYIQCDQWLQENTVVSSPENRLYYSVNDMSQSPMDWACNLDKYKLELKQHCHPYGFTTTTNLLWKFLCKCAQTWASKRGAPVNEANPYQRVTLEIYGDYMLASAVQWKHKIKLEYTNTVEIMQFGSCCNCGVHFEKKWKGLNPPADSVFKPVLACIISKENIEHTLSCLEQCDVTCSRHPNDLNSVPPTELRMLFCQREEHPTCSIMCKKQPTGPKDKHLYMRFGLETHLC